MAGRVRQPIDEKAFEKYLSENVPAVKTPIELKQVGTLRGAGCGSEWQEEKGADERSIEHSSASASPTRRTRSRRPTASAS